MGPGPHVELVQVPPIDVAVEIRTLAAVGRAGDRLRVAGVQRSLSIIRAEPGFADDLPVFVHSLRDAGPELGVVCAFKIDGLSKIDPKGGVKAERLAADVGSEGFGGANDQADCRVDNGECTASAVGSQGLEYLRLPLPRSTDVVKVEWPLLDRVADCASRPLTGINDATIPTGVWDPGACSPSLGAVD